MILPNVVIGGAPKCGTSSLFAWLADHPEVCGSRIKETNFLLDQGHPLFVPEMNFHDHGLEAYGSFFDECGRSGQEHLFLEATTHYLYQETALEVLSSMRPLPHVIFLLRKPSERVYSSFQYARNNEGGLRSDVPFSTFVSLSPDDEARIVTEPHWAPHARIWRQDVEMSRYVLYLDRWRERFPRDRLHIHLLEDLRADPRGLMKALAHALGIDPSFYHEYPFPRKNASYQVASQRLHKLVLRASRLAPPVGRSAVKSLYLRLFTKPSSDQRTPAVEQVLAALDQRFRPDNERLARDFGVNVGPWS